MIMLINLYIYYIMFLYYQHHTYRFLLHTHGNARGILLVILTWPTGINFTQDGYSDQNCIYAILAQIAIHVSKTQVTLTFHKP
jgi:hypothetical protein